MRGAENQTVILAPRLVADQVLRGLRRLAGRDMNARAVVRFDDGVEREFVLEYAGLKLLEDLQL